jgi:hypothetical protein
MERDRSDMATIVPPTADPRAAVPLAGTGGKRSGIGETETATKTTTGTAPGGGIRWLEEVMAGVHQAHPSPLTDPPPHRRRDSPRRRSRSSSRDQSGSDHSVDRFHKKQQRSQSPERGGGGGRGDRNRSRSRSGSPRRDNDRRGGQQLDNCDNHYKGSGRRRSSEAIWGPIAHSLTVLSAAQLNIKKRDVSRKSRLGRMSEEQADLFRLLSAKDWNDNNPKLNEFTRRFVANKELNKAIDTIASKLRKWLGQVSTK